MFSIELPSFDDSANPEVARRAAEILHVRQQIVYRATDRMFAWLLLAQYLLGIVLAITVSPRTWAGDISRTHIHVWAAFILGGLIVALPIWLAHREPGRELTRHVIAAGQMLSSSLLIHLSGGRLETHFHVFGSLAFLAIYRDWRVLCTASLVVALDHWLRGLYWPQSVYGTLVSGQWRWLEHAGWVLFEVFFLVISCHKNVQEMQQDAFQRAQLELSHADIERQVSSRTADLLQKNRELDEFTYVASHDLQEPLRKLTSFSKLLQQDIGTELNERAQRDLFFIADAAGRMRDLIQDLLALSRAGRAAMKVVECPLSGCVTRALASLEVGIHDAGAEIRYDSLPCISADATLITQVYQNLIANAVKFVPPGRKPKIQLTARLDTDHWELSVADNGIGIRREHIDRLFKPFQRLHGRGEYHGTGIGLAICRKAVERHGGRIWVESRIGNGSEFKFTIPILPENSACLLAIQGQDGSSSCSPTMIPAIKS